MKITTFALAGLALLAAAPALAEPACLRNIDIYSFDGTARQTLIVENTRHIKYKLKVIGSCSDLRFQQRLAFKTIGGGSLSCVSKGDQILTREFGGIRGVCTVMNIELYTPAMQAADKAAKAAKDAAKAKGN